MFHCSAMIISELELDRPLMRVRWLRIWLRCPPATSKRRRRVETSTGGPGANLRRSAFFVENYLNLPLPKGHNDLNIHSRHLCVHRLTGIHIWSTGFYCMMRSISRVMILIFPRVYSSKKAFNVDSPSFVPAGLASSGTSTISSRAANATPFIPRDRAAASGQYAVSTSHFIILIHVM